MDVAFDAMARPFTPSVAFVSNANYNVMLSHNVAVEIEHISTESAITWHSVYFNDVQQQFNLVWRWGFSCLGSTDRPTGPPIFNVKCASTKNERERRKKQANFSFHALPVNFLQTFWLIDAISIGLQSNRLAWIHLGCFIVRVWSDHFANGLMRNQDIMRSIKNACEIWIEWMNRLACWACWFS